MPKKKFLDPRKIEIEIDRIRKAKEAGPFSSKDERRCLVVSTATILGLIIIGTFVVTTSTIVAHQNIIAAILVVPSSALVVHQLIVMASGFVVATASEAHGRRRLKDGDRHSDCV